MKKIRGMRWWMVALVTAGLIVNYLARNTLSVAAPTMMHELNFTTKEYSYVVVAWQICYAVMQPIAGFILDAVGTKIGFAVFAFLWSLACAAAALSRTPTGNYGHRLSTRRLISSFPASIPRIPRRHRTTAAP